MNQWEQIAEAAIKRADQKAERQHSELKELESWLDACCLDELTLLRDAFVKRGVDAVLERGHIIQDVSVPCVWLRVDAFLMALRVSARQTSSGKQAVIHIGRDEAGRYRSPAKLREAVAYVCRDYVNQI